MDQPSTPPADDLGTLAADARALLAATAHVAGDQVGEARQRLTAALEKGRQMLGQVQEKVVAGAKATDVAVHKHPYLAIGVAVGVGALIGFLLSRRSCRSCG